MNPSQTAEYADTRYGWSATQARLDRHLVEFVEALRVWQSRDMESPETHYLRALEVERVARNISAETAQLARLSSYRGAP